MNRNVTTSVIASVEVTSLALCRSLDVGEPPIRLMTPTLTLSTSRHDPADLGRLRADLGFDSDSGISLPADFHVDTSASILLTVNNCLANYTYGGVCNYVFMGKAKSKHFRHMRSSFLNCKGRAFALCPAEAHDMGRNISRNTSISTLGDYASSKPVHVDWRRYERGFGSGWL